MILEPNNKDKPPNYDITEEEIKILQQICYSWKTPYKQHGVSRANRPLYNTLVKLQKYNLIRRKGQGYTFHPTKYGWIKILNEEEKPKQPKRKKPKQSELT